MRMLERAGLWIRNLRGWRRMLFAFGMGAVSALGFAPVEFFPILLLGFASLLLLLDGVDESTPLPPFASQARPHAVATDQAPPPSGASHHGGGGFGAAFVVGWAFAFGQFLVGLHWIGYAFLVDPSAHL